jgi:hypothetical protein
VNEQAVNPHVEPLHDPLFAQLNEQVAPSGQAAFGQIEPGPSQLNVQVAPGAHWTFQPPQSLPPAHENTQVAPAAHVTVPEHCAPVEHAMSQRCFGPQATSTPRHVPWLPQL